MRMRSPVNRYKVPKSQWRKWTPEAQRMFNTLYGQMRQQHLFAHPKTRHVASEQWKTTRWNAAWIAADIAADQHKGTRYV